MISVEELRRYLQHKLEKLSKGVNFSYRIVEKQDSLVIEVNKYKKTRFIRVKPALGGTVVDCKLRTFIDTDNYITQTIEKL